MVQQSTKTKVFEKLIGSLQSAERGSRELDIIVSFVLGDTSSDAGKMIQLLVEEGYPWEVISELVDEDLAPYTSSLDAAVPGENIVLVAHSPRRGKWAAMHRTPHGQHVVVWAATEILARRTAALKALRPDLQAHRDAEVPSAPARAAAAAPAAQPDWQATVRPGGPKEPVHDAEEEWKILF